jgi:hypothetical protein
MVAQLTKKTGRWDCWVRKDNHQSQERHEGFEPLDGTAVKGFANCEVDPCPSFEYLEQTSASEVSFSLGTGKTISRDRRFLLCGIEGWLWFCRVVVWG